MKTSTEQILDSFAGTAASFNKLLKQEGIKEKLIRGNGYYYFTEGQSHTWYSSSVLVYSLRKCTMRYLLGEYLTLKYNIENHDAGEQYVEWAAKEGFMQVMRWKGMSKLCIFAGNPLDVLRFLQKQEADFANDNPPQATVHDDENGDPVIEKDSILELLPEVPKDTEGMKGFICDLVEEMVAKVIEDLGWESSKDSQEADPKKVKKLSQSIFEAIVSDYRNGVRD